MSTNTYGARNGKLMKETYGNGDEVSTDYDNLDRAVNRKANGKVQYSWAYDGEGNIGRLEDQVNGVTHRYEYDTTGRLQRETGSDGRELYYKYDVNNNVTGQSYTMDGETRTMSHEIGEDNILTGSTLDGDVQVTKTYDGLNRLKRQDTKLGTSNPNVRYAYTNGSRTNETTTQVGVESHYMGTELRDDYRYEYDELGNMTEALQAGEQACDYEYDSVGELTRVDDKHAGKTTLYTYDKDGNILKRTEYPYKNLTSATKVVNYTYGDGGWKDLLTGYNGKTITYDGIGNPIQTTHGEKYWWTGRQLDKMMTDVGRELAFKYSEDGIRTEKRDSRGEIHEYLLEGSRILRERIVDDETGSVLHTLWYDYDGNGGLTSVEYDGEKYLYKRNMQGDILGLYNGSKEQVVSYWYDAWGKLLGVKDKAGKEITDKESIGLRNPFRYRGYYYDSESYLYYLNSRYYDPDMGRFINADGYASTGQGIIGANMFAYANNNPVMLVDPSGTMPCASYCIYPNVPHSVDLCRMHGVYNGQITFDENDSFAIADSKPTKNNPPDHPNYKSPKKGDKKVKNPNGPGFGWTDKGGDVWVWTPDMHGGEGWTVQQPKGGHYHAYPGGAIRRSTGYKPSNNRIGGLIVGSVFVGVLVLDDLVGFVADDALIPAALGCFAVWDTMDSNSSCDICGQ